MAVEVYLFWPLARDEERSALTLKLLSFVRTALLRQLRRAVCRKQLAAAGIGTIAIPGCATRHSRFTGCCELGLPKKLPPIQKLAQRSLAR